MNISKYQTNKMQDYLRRFGQETLISFTPAGSGQYPSTEDRWCVHLNDKSPSAATYDRVYGISPILWEAFEKAVDAQNASAMAPAKAVTAKDMANALLSAHPELADKIAAIPIA